MGEPNDRDSDRMKELKQLLVAAAPKSPEDETAGGIARQRAILAQMAAERSRADQARNDETNAEEAAGQQRYLSRLRSDGGGQ